MQEGNTQVSLGPAKNMLAAAEAGKPYLSSCHGNTINNTVEPV